MKVAILRYQIFKFGYNFSQPKGKTGTIGYKTGYTKTAKIAKKYQKIPKKAA
jgi:hypothetical protein